MGGVGNGAAEEDWCWDLNPGTTARPVSMGAGGVGSGDPTAWATVRTTALGCSLLPCGLGSRRDFVWKKRGEWTLAGGL